MIFRKRLSYEELFDEIVFHCTHGESSQVITRILNELGEQYPKTFIYCILRYRRVLSNFDIRINKLRKLPGKVHYLELLLPIEVEGKYFAATAIAGKLPWFWKPYWFKFRKNVGVDDRDPKYDKLVSAFTASAPA